MEDEQEVLECWESDQEVAQYMFWTSRNDIKKTIEWLEFETSKIVVERLVQIGICRERYRVSGGTGLIYFEDEYNKFEIGYNLEKNIGTKAMQRKL